MPQPITIEEELQLPTATIQLMRMDFTTPINDVQSADDGLLINMCLTPRPARAEARFAHHWATSRFETLGQVFIIPPRETLQYRAPMGRQLSVLCHLQPQALTPWLDSLDWSERRLEASLDIGPPRIATLLRFMAQELRYPSLGQTVVVELVAQQISIELARYFTAIDEPATTGGLASWRLKLIDERLRERGTSPTLFDLATLCNLSVRQLTRGFRVSRGCSIAEYVTQHRMDMAKRLLAGGESIKAVAQRMGFSSASSFSFAFRRSTGFTPRLFRDRILRGI